MQKIEILDSLVVFINTYTKVASKPRFSPVNFEMAAHAPINSLFLSTIPVSDVIDKAVAFTIFGAIGASENPTILSSATGLLPVLSPLPDGTYEQMTLSAYLRQFGLKLKDVIPRMISRGLVVKVGHGLTTAFALPGTIAVVSATTPLSPATHESICSTVFGHVSQFGPTLLSQIGNLPGVSGAVGPDQTLSAILKSDQRLKVTGTCGDVKVDLAVQDAPMPPPRMSISPVFDMCAQICSRASELAPIRVSKCGIDSCIKPLMDQLKELDPKYKLANILAGDQHRRFKITGSLGMMTIELATSAGGQAAFVPPVTGGHVTLISIPNLTKDLVSCIGSDGILASRFGNRDVVKTMITDSDMTLKALMGYMPGYEMRTAVPGNPGTMTIFARTVVPEA